MGAVTQCAMASGSRMGFEGKVRTYGPGRERSGLERHAKCCRGFTLTDDAIWVDVDGGSIPFDRGEALLVAWKDTEGRYHTRCFQPESGTTRGRIP